MRRAYLAPSSDEVALLVLAHQTQMHNLITLTNYQTRIALHALASRRAADRRRATPPRRFPLPENTRQQFEKPAEQLLRYLLFANEAPLPGLDAKQVHRVLRVRARVRGARPARLSRAARCGTSTCTTGSSATPAAT